MYISRCDLSHFELFYLGMISSGERFLGDFGLIANMSHQTAKIYPAQGNLRKITTLKIRPKYCFKSVSHGCYKFELFFKSN